MPRFLTTLVNLVEPNGTFSSSLVSFLPPVVSQLSSLLLQVCSLFEMKLNFFLFLNSLNMTLAGLTPNYRCRVPGCESANASYYDNQVNHHIERRQFHQEWRWFGQVVTNKEVRSFTPCFTKTPLKDFSLKGPKQLTWLVQGTSGLRAPLSGSKGEFINCWFFPSLFLCWGNYVKVSILKDGSGCEANSAIFTGKCFNIQYLRQALRSCKVSRSRGLPFNTL